jgi:hypothetical protein
MLPKDSTGPMPKKTVTPADSSSKKSAGGPHGGGTPYHQAKIGGDFMVQKPIEGHTQKSNVKE